MPLNRRETLRRSAANLAAVATTPVERFLAEIEFAEGLTALLGKKAAGWPRLIDRAFAIVHDAVEDGNADVLEKAVDRAESLLAPIGKIAKTYTIHCAGHGHIDMNWVWSWPETVAVTNDTFLTVLKLMDEFDDFCFTQSQASVYDIVRRYNPELFERIRQRVKEGRWEVAASHWVEGDRNLAGGEALTRHLLYTRQFMAEHFDLTPEDVAIDWSPDTFGHALTIPTIDSRGGVKYYYMWRGGSFDKPPVFWYQGPDGSRILVNLETTSYNGSIGTQDAMTMLKVCKKTGLRDFLNVYGVGDHGGGPTRRDILRCYELDGWPIYPTFRLTTIGNYYKILEKHGDRWPVIDRELNFEFTGCYTSQSRIKRINRLGENYMVEAEIAAALANRAVGREYPGRTLRDNWVDVLFSHFHDILPGSGIAETRQYSQGLFQRVAAATGMIKTTPCARSPLPLTRPSPVPPRPPKMKSCQESQAWPSEAERGAAPIGAVSPVPHMWSTVPVRLSCSIRPPGVAAKSFRPRSGTQTRDQLAAISRQRSLSSATPMARSSPPRRSIPAGIGAICSWISCSP